MVESPRGQNLGKNLIRRCTKDWGQVRWMTWGQVALSDKLSEQSAGPEAHAADAPHRNLLVVVLTHVGDERTGLRRELRTSGFEAGKAKKKILCLTAFSKRLAKIGGYAP